LCIFSVSLPSIGKSLETSPSMWNPSKSASMYCPFLPMTSAPCLQRPPPLYRRRPHHLGWTR
jgi:hypothetical protein